MQEPIKIIIVDDHQVMLQGLSQLFYGDTEFDIIAEEYNFENALTAIKKYKPQVMLTDISLPDGDGILLFQKAKIFLPHIKAICLTMHKEQAYVAKAYQAGVHAYLPKETGIEEIKNVIKQVVIGKVFFNELLLNMPKNTGNATGISKEKLSFREIEIIQLLAEGLSSKEIAEKIHLSPYTIDTHRKNIASKLNIKNVGELIKIARELGVII